MNNFNTTNLEFNCVSVMIQAPHIAFQMDTRVVLTIDFGEGSIPTTTYQANGNNDTNQPIYLTGGGGVSLNTFSNKIIGALQLKGVLHYSEILQTEPSYYYGSVALTIRNSECEVSGNLIGIGVGFFKDLRLNGSIFGTGNVTIANGIRRISFPNTSLCLNLPIPKLQI